MSRADKLCTRRKEQGSAHIAYLKILKEIQHPFLTVPFPNTQCLPLPSRIIQCSGQNSVLKVLRIETIGSDCGKMQLMEKNTAWIVIKYAAEIHHRTRNHYGFLVV